MDFTAYQYVLLHNNIDEKLLIKYSMLCKIFRPVIISVGWLVDYDYFHTLENCAYCGK